MKTRLVAALAVAAGLALATSGHAAATKVTFKDPKGDALAMQSSMDIVETTFATEGTSVTSKVRGKRVTTYTPTAVVITLKLAAPPSKDAGRTYAVEGQLSGCGLFALSHSPAAALGDYNKVQFGCGGPASETGDALILDVSPKIKGSAITWRLPLKSFPKGYRRDTIISSLESYTAVVEPVFGILSPADLVGQTAIDGSVSDEDFEIQ